MGKFDGKIFLELGTSVGSVDIVKYAKSEGAYVIVTDYLPTEKSEAKRFADETAMISTLDVEALCDFAEKKRIDGVFCGVSEANLLSVYAIAEKLNLPCYFTKEQWSLVQNKSQFKSLCEKYGVPVTKRFYLSDNPSKEELASVIYPVIVKPVDQGAGIGIHICNTEQELLEGYKDAYEKSFIHKVVVEQYIIGNEFSAYYTFIDGECRLSIVFDKYLNYDQEGLIPLPEAYVFPSRVQDIYIKEISDNVKKMFLSIGLKNGVACIQGATNGKDIGIFEAGLRLGGTALYNFVDNINGISMIKLMVDYALLGKTDEDINLEDPYLQGKRGCLLSVLNGGGTIGKISGFAEACEVEGVVETQMRYKEGDTIAKSGTLKQSHLRFYVIRDSAEELKDSVQKIQKLISVKDMDGNNMLLSDFDTDKLIY